MRFVLIVEDWADARTGALLADRVFLECGPEWVDADSLSSLRQWTGIDPDAAFTRWMDVGKHRLAAKVRPHGRGGGPDHLAARRALILIELAGAESPASAVVLLRDLDAQPERREGLNSARRDFGERMPIIIGAADPKREAWVLNAYVPETPAEQQCLTQTERELGFDPCRNPTRLRGDRRRHGQSDRDIKAVLSLLIASEPSREIRCLETAPLGKLMERGTESGLVDFLAEVHSRLLPLLGLNLNPTQDCAALAPATGRRPF